jgi:hypothetical protein
MQKRFASSILASAAFLCAALDAPAAHARACAAASDCPTGFDCAPTGTTSDGGPAGTCYSLPCQSDSDCGAGFRCYLDVGTICTPGTDGGSSCSPASQCVPQWDAPCTDDAQCGTGFTCSPSGIVGYNCGKDQDASQPAYVMATVVSCSDVPSLPLLPPPDSGFPSIPALCDAGSTCTKTTTNACVAQQPSTPCTVDSQCPSTWTCGCQMTCTSGGLEMPAGVDANASPAACTQVCIPPNSDLVIEVCNGVEGLGGGGALGGSTSSPAPADGGARSDTAAPGATSASPASHGGCALGREGASEGWALGAVAALACVARRARRKRSAEITGRS